MIRSLLSLFLLFSLPCSLLSQTAPLQADIRVRVSEADDDGVPFKAQLLGGNAKVSGRIWNLPGRETAYVLLTFNYRTSADIALDEIISRILVSVSDNSGARVSRVAINPDTVHLNPNRVPLYYSATLYTPAGPPPQTYTVRVQVFGNYE